LATPSLHVAGWQTPATQFLLAQSDPSAHRWNAAHGAQLAPPQSTSVSVPFCAPSVQPGDWQTLVCEQNPVVQSPFTVHGPPTLQPEHEVPPQSTPVSEPFFTPSVQLAWAHEPEVQTPVTQSLGAAQESPGAQSPHEVPPQSTSVSAPFRTPSVQAGA
jgi:hypothetical protein